MAKVQSVEPNIADLANGWLKSYKLPYKLEQECAPLRSGLTNSILLYIIITEY